MDRGYIKLYRRTFDHWIWDDSPKSKFEAWILLLKMANHEDKKIALGNEVIEVSAGDIITSEVTLSRHLKWSRSKLRAFLTLLENDGMITQKKDSKKTCLSICNYDEYNMGGEEEKTSKRQQKDSKKTAKKHQTDSNQTAFEHNEELLNTKENINTPLPPPGEKPTKKKSTRFVKPSLEEITAYCQQRKNNVNPQAFIDHYESKGWKVGKNGMKDWKAAVRTWERNSYGNGNRQNQQQSELNFSDPGYYEQGKSTGANRKDNPVF